MNLAVEFVSKVNDEPPAFPFNRNFNPNKLFPIRPFEARTIANRQSSFVNRQSVHFFFFFEPNAPSSRRRTFQPSISFRTSFGFGEPSDA